MLAGIQVGIDLFFDLYGFWKRLLINANRTY